MTLAVVLPVLGTPPGPGSLGIGLILPVVVVRVQLLFLPLRAPGFLARGHGAICLAGDFRMGTKRGLAMLADPEHGGHLLHGSRGFPENRRKR